MAYFQTRRSSVAGKADRDHEYREDITSAPMSLYREQGPSARGNAPGRTVRIQNSASPAVRGRHASIGGSTTRDGFYAVGADGVLYKNNLQIWNAVATPVPSVTSFAMRKDGVVFALATSRLCIFDGETAEVKSIIGTVKYQGRAITTIRGLTFSEQPDELWGVALNGTFEGVSRRVGESESRRGRESGNCVGKWVGEVEGGNGGKGSRTE